MPVVRYLEWYSYDAERLVGRVDLTLTLADLQELFGVPSENPMYDCWEVKPEHVEYLQSCIVQIIDLNRYAYFVSAELG